MATPFAGDVSGRASKARPSKADKRLSDQRRNVYFFHHIEPLNEHRKEGFSSCSPSLPPSPPGLNLDTQANKQSKCQGSLRINAPVSPSSGSSRGRVSTRSTRSSGSGETR